MHLKPAEWYLLLLVTDACIHVYAVLNFQAKWLPCFHVQCHPSLLNVPASLTIHNVYMILLGLTAVKQIHVCSSESTGLNIFNLTAAVCLRSLPACVRTI